MSSCPVSRLRDGQVHPDAERCSHYSSEVMLDLLRDFSTPVLLDIVNGAIEKFIIINTVYSSSWQNCMFSSVQTVFANASLTLPNDIFESLRSSKEESIKDSTRNFIENNRSVSIYIGEGGLFKNLSNALFDILNDTTNLNFGLDDIKSIENIISKYLDNDKFLKHGSKGTYICIGKSVARSITFGVLANFAIRNYKYDESVNLPFFRIESNYRKTIKEYKNYLRTHNLCIEP